VEQRVAQTLTVMCYRTTCVENYAGSGAGHFPLGLSTADVSPLGHFECQGRFPLGQ